METKTVHKIDPRLYIRSVTPEGEIDGYICIWGDFEHRDSYDTWFDRAAPPDMALEFLPQPIYYEHGADGQISKVRIGKVVQAWADKVGIKFRGLLDKTSEHFAQMVNEIKQGLLATSSGTAGHLAEFDEDGRFVNWPLVDLSLTKSPAESRMPLVSLVRSKEGRMFAGFSSTQLVISDDKPAGTGGDPIDGGAPRVADRGVTEGASAVQPKPISKPTRSKRGMLTLEQLGVAPGASIDEVWKALVAMVGPAAAAAMLDEITGEQPAADDVPVDPNAAPAMMSNDAGRSKPKPAPVKPPEDPAIVALRAEIAELRQGQMTEPPAPTTPPVRVGPKIGNVVDLRFDHLTAEEMGLGLQVAESIAQRRHGRNQDFLGDTYFRAMRDKTQARLDRGDKVMTDPTIRSKFTRANEVMGTGQTGYGAEYAFDLPGTALWQSVRFDTLLYPTLIQKGMEEKEIPQGYKSETIPLEDSDPTWYVASQSTDVDATSGQVTPKFATSKSGTGQRQITVAKLSVAIPYSGEETEDSIIAFAPEQMRKIQVTAPEQMESILINGDTDTTASTNINLIDGTPNTTTTKPSYTLLNGFLKLCLITNTANKRDGGTFDETDFLETLKLMPGKYRQNRDRLLYVMDSDTAIAASNIAAFKTKDVFTAATLENGVLTKAWRIDVLESGFMALANSSGKIPAAGGTLGRLLLIRPDRWTFRWKRRLQIETDYNAYADAYTLVAHMRFGLAYFDTEASAVSYNLTV